MPKYRFGSSWLWPIVVLLIAFGAFYFKPWQTKPSETISVTATGHAQVTPNVATITVTIESKNPNLDLARKENEEKTTKIIVKLKELGVEEKDIKTQNISGGQGYEILEAPQTLIYPPRPPRPTNQFSTSLEITITNFEITDEIISALTQNSTTNLYGPNLTVGEEAKGKAKSEARENAVEEARKKAQELAKLSGRNLGKAVKIQEQGDVIFPQPLVAASELDLKQKASQIQPGEQEVTVNLNVEFAFR